MITNARKPKEASMKTQPKLALSQPSTAEATVARLSVKRTPHNTKSMEMPNEIQNTPGAIIAPKYPRMGTQLPLKTSKQHSTKTDNRIGCDRTLPQKRSGHAPVEDQGAKQPRNVGRHTIRTRRPLNPLIRIFH